MNQQNDLNTGKMAAMLRIW